MIHPKKNRLDYGKQLIPPAGYELTYAIGTSYSLDLEALMLIPVAFFYSQTLDADPKSERTDVIDAITRASEKITIYCQRGKIKVPKIYHPILAYWEKGIEEIVMDHFASSFHPKVWIIRYDAPKQEPAYRLIVTSRNMTFTRDWDLGFTTDGFAGEKVIPRTKPLVTFLHYLNKKGKRKFPKKFIEDLEKVDFEVPDQFRLINLFPIGCPNTSVNDKFQNPLLKRTWEDLLVISPFIDVATLKKLKECTLKKFFLLSRKEELDLMPEEVLKGVECYQFSRIIRDAELLEELRDDLPIEPQYQNIHAKLFIGLKEAFPHWFLGSANSTSPAFEARNIEFLAEIKGNGAGQRPRDILKLLTIGEKNDIPIFNQYIPEERSVQSEGVSIESSLRKLIYDITRLPIHGSVVQGDGGLAYDLTLEIDARKLHIPKDFTVKVRPLSEKHKTAIEIMEQKVNLIDSFTNFTLTQLTAFITFQVHYFDEEKHFTVLMDIELPDARFSRIFSSIIDSREKFLVYLTFLLTGEEIKILNQQIKEEDQSGQNHAEHSGGIINGAPVFEKLMVAASRYPNRLVLINKLIERLVSETNDTNNQIVPKEFKDLWKIFEQYLAEKNN